MERARALAPDLVVLDLGLPGLDKLDVARQLRKTSRVPVIILTARGDELDRVLGLELGADDYLVKPFSPRELVARVRAVLRRVDERRPKPATSRWCGATWSSTPPAAGSRSPGGRSTSPQRSSTFLPISPASPAGSSLERSS